MAVPVTTDVLQRCVPTLLPAAVLALKKPASGAALKRKGKGDDVTENHMDAVVWAHNSKCHSLALLRSHPKPSDTPSHPTDTNHNLIPRPHCMFFMQP